MSESKYFGTVDLLVFIGLLCVSLFVGFYYAITDRTKKTTENYYFGNRAMSPIPVGLSISVSFISALTVIGFPTEAYGYGTATLWYSLAGIIGNAICCIYYVPLIHRLGLSSIYEYLEIRFSRKVRAVESVIINLTNIFYMGMTTYLPALALNAVTPLSLNLNIALTSLLCTVYTTLGGMKAVIWTDTLQAFIMFGGVFAALVKGLIEVGGFGNVWEALERGNRNTAMNFSLDPTYPYTFWTILIGQGIGWASLGTNQAISQRYLTCKSPKHARIAALVSMVPSCTFFLMSAMCGCVMYAYFEGCDPLKSGQIAKADQLMPYMAVRVFHNMPGMAGLFVSAAFSATLSTVSSGINASGALILQDFIIPWRPNLSELTRLSISKGLVLTFGILVMAWSLCIEHINSTIIQLSFTIFGSIGGPLFGVFTLGLFFPWCNSLGALVGQFVGMAFMLWVGAIALIYGKPKDRYSFLPTTTDQCNVAYQPNATTAATWGYSSSTFNNESTVAYTTGSVSESTGVSGLFAVSHLYYTVISMSVTIIVGMIVSFISGPNNPAKSDPKLFLAFVDNKLLPKKVRTFFRFGVPPLAKVPNDEETMKEEKQCQDYELCPREDALLSTETEKEDI